MTRPVPFVLAGTDHGPMIVNRLDFARSSDGGVFGVGHQLLSFGQFDREEIELTVGWLQRLHRERGDGIVALDVGANVGVHTLTWAHVMTGWGRVISFEPQDRIFYALAGNVALANAFNAEVHQAAVDATSGALKIPRLDYSRSSSYGSLELLYSRDAEFIGQNVSYLERDLVEVRSIAIDDLNLPRLDLLKIDVERMEVRVLQGARRTLEKHRPVVYVEVFKSGVDEVKAFFDPTAYRFENYGGNLLAVPE